jgi:nitrogen-specific signal transduction histidine kinase
MPDREARGMSFVPAMARKWTISRQNHATAAHGIFWCGNPLQKQASSQVDEKSLRYLQTILEASKRMGNLIDDLLAFSRIGRAETRRTMVNLDQLVKEVVSKIAPDTRGRNILWKIDPIPICYGDRAMLRLVFVNLLSNAVSSSSMAAVYGRTPTQDQVPSSSSRCPARLRDVTISAPATVRVTTRGSKR